MTVSLEGREPFLDHRVIEYAATLPNEFKYYNGSKKYILKEIVHQYIPKEMMDRPKMGFAIPIANWMTNELRDYVESFINEKNIKEQLESLRMRYHQQRQMAITEELLDIVSGFEALEQGLGTIGPDSTPIFVLPGNPVGALLSFDVFVRPLIRRLMGHSKLHHRIIEARLETTVEGARDDARYVRARVSRSGDFPLVKSVENESDHPFASLGTADALIVVPPGVVRMNAGDTVKVMQLVDLSDE
jgi:hypothetical protein